MSNAPRIALNRIANGFSGQPSRVTGHASHCHLIIGSSFSSDIVSVAGSDSPGRVPGNRGGCRGGAGAPICGDATRDQTRGDRPPPSIASEVRSPNKNFGAHRRVEEGPQWFFGDLTPKTRVGSALNDAPLIDSTVASRKRAPAPRSADPSSTLRRSLLPGSRSYF